MTVITESRGDIFSAPLGSVLIHSCNCLGQWGSGIALEFKKRFPSAYQTYQKHCLPSGTFTSTSHQLSLLGTTLLIPPAHLTASPSASGSTLASVADHNNDQQRPAQSSYWIACLFTSLSYGKKTTKKEGVSPPDVVLRNTALAMRDLERQLIQLRAGQIEGGRGGRILKAEPGDCYSVRINSGGFGVKWENTKRVLKGEGIDITVLVREEDWEGEDVDDDVEKQAQGSDEKKEQKKPRKKKAVE